MARTYKRDSNGRFAGGGGGGSRGGGKKAGGKAKTSKPQAGPRPGQLERGAKRAKANLKRGEIQGMYGVGTSRNMRRTVMGAQKAIGRYKEAAAANSKAAQAARAKRFSSKAAPNTAKAKYKAATSKVRELKMYRGGKTDATVRNAQARVTRMQRNRKSSRARV